MAETKLWMLLNEPDWTRIQRKKLQVSVLSNGYVMVKDPHTGNTGRGLSVRRAFESFSKTRS